MTNEEKMKLRGEDRVWKTIRSKSGLLKKVTQTQIGQQLILEDALNIFPSIRKWIECDSFKHDRHILQEYFKCDDFLLLKIVEIFLSLAATSYVNLNDSKKIQTRHKDISHINEKILKGVDFNLTWKVIEVIVEYSKYFETVYTKIPSGDAILKSVKYTCNLPNDIFDNLIKEASSAFFPEPMTEPPIDWGFNGRKIKGGYKTYQYEMIRANGFIINYKNFSQKIFDAINYIQSTPWKINKKMVAIIKSDLKAPIKSDFVKTEYPDDTGTEWNIDFKSDKINISKEKEIEIKAIRTAYNEILQEYLAEAKEFESAMGKYRAVVMALGIAERYADEEKIYFPHSFDFRGRLYPLPVGLTPQGSDSVKAMLDYAEGEILTAGGEEWAWAYLASLYGDDKIDFDERVKKGKELLHAAYVDADEPYQFLAHQLELQEFVKNPDYIFKGRIHLDACNSGSQFTSAITGDIAGCIATNVIPTIHKDGSQSRQDAYLLVSNKALERTKSKIGVNVPEEENNALEWLKTILLENGRKFCKTPVMVSNYGGTEGGRTEIILNLLRELKIDRKMITKKNAAMYSKILGDSISGVLIGGKAFETYIQKMNGIITMKNKSIKWTTSDGFHVTHVKNKELKAKRVSCLLPGSRRQTTIQKKIYSKDVSPAKMKSAISPNYIHSLDAELLRRVALKLKSAGLTYTDWIHDSFGCHPNHVDLMLYVTKDEFQRLIKNMPLLELDKQLREQAGTTKPVLKKLDALKVPIFERFDFYLPLLKKSNWFFS